MPTPSRAISIAVLLVSVVGCSHLQQGLFPRSPSQVPEFEQGGATRVLIFMAAPTVREAKAADTLLAEHGTLAILDIHDGTRLFVSYQAETPNELPGVVQELQLMVLPIPLTFSGFLLPATESCRPLPNKPLQLTSGRLVGPVLGRLLASTAQGVADAGGAGLGS